MRAGLAGARYLDAAVVGVGDVEVARGVAIDAQRVLQAIRAQIAVNIAVVEEADCLVVPETTVTKSFSKSARRIVLDSLSAK